MEFPPFPIDPKTSHYPLPHYMISILNPLFQYPYQFRVQFEIFIYPITDGYTSLTIVNTLFATQSNPYPLNQSYNKIKTAIYTSDTSYWGSDIVVSNLAMSMHYEQSLALTCSVSGSSTVVYSFSNKFYNLGPELIDINY